MILGQLAFFAILALIAVVGVSPISALTKIACEHRGDQQVSCPGGHYINVLGANYGRTNANECRKERNTNCHASSSFNIIKGWCQGKQSCTLKPENRVFGDPCGGVVKYIELNYECVYAGSSQGPNHVVACEHQRDVTVRCPAGEYIDVVDAYYGRTDAHTCGYDARTNCKASSSGRKIRTTCHGKNSCVLAPKVSLFGDPCGGVHKYIEMKYKCRDTIKGLQQKYACENRDETLSCPPGKFINVVSAYYGRTDAHQCGYETNTNCYAANSPGIITKNCQGKRSCLLQPKNQVFGDPCGGVTKYIHVKYECTAKIILKKIACERGGAQKVSCPRGQIMGVHRAYYGRTNSRVCGGDSEITCQASRSYGKIRRICNKRSSCVLNPSNSVFGDPCGGVTKYIQYDYYCYPPRAHNQNRVTVCENEVVKIECPAGKKIVMKQGFYGRDEPYSCKNGPIKTTDCKAGNSFTKIRNLCGGKNWCSLSANNSKFGDPCRGTVKFIKARFVCL